jgi:nitroreductase
MAEGIDLFEAIDTQRAIRYFKSDPVPDELITRLLQAAIKGPSGGIKQGWGFIVIRDQEIRRKIGDLYRTGSNFDIRPDMTAQERRVYTAAQHLEDHMDEVPVLILACIEAAPGATVSGGSIFPAVQNILLAARGLGLGSALTTRQTRFEAEIKSMLGIPENVATVALLPVGFPAEGSRYGPTRRRPLKEVAFSDRWGESWRDNGSA